MLIVTFIKYDAFMFHKIIITFNRDIKINTVIKRNHLAKLTVPTLVKQH